MVKIYKQPFAHDGDTIAIPDASQPDGKMSSADGWTPDYDEVCLTVLGILANDEAADKRGRVINKQLA